ncbi:AAA family ATPase [Chengkuizengella axinellae]|uniref:AAA family ATPase n=1 Tax=Chengkuizengella axinellae TaxID=3064388 RepID=A0ABT9IYX8_9BACL|nr:AAA family ATPase [Chengkuizengella sp. 2205SS18-9]MDP5274576.1 AAA family ATPase [Chengkuizengella sp. 2205SS18-9]
MRINHLEINGFGILNHLKFELKQPVTLFYGHNEAGKSTLMSFIRNMLFGFPKRTHLQQRYEPVYGGLHGGLVTLLDEDGEQLRIERIQGKGSTFIAGDGSIMNEAEFQQRLGGISQQFFNDLFAFSLSELQEIRTLQSDEMSSYLYNSGMGIHANRIMEAEKKLISGMEKLFKPRGKNQMIINQIKSMETISNKLRANRGDIEKYNHIQQHLSQVNEQIDVLEQSIKNKKEQINWYELCLKVKEPFNRKEKIHEELHDLPQFEGFPKDAASKYDKLMVEQDRLKLELNQLMKKRDHVKKELSPIIVELELITILPQLDQLNEQLGIYENTKTTMIEVKTETKQLNETLQIKLRKVNESWTMDQLKSFSTSVASREKVERFKQSFDEINKEKEKVQYEFGELAQKIEAEKQLIEKLKLLNTPLMKRKNDLVIQMNLNNTEQLNTIVANLKTELNQLQLIKKEYRFDKTRIMDLQQHMNLINTMKDGQKNKGAAWVLLTLNLVVPSLFYFFDQMSFVWISFISILGLQVMFYVISKNSKENKSLSDSIIKHQTAIAELETHMKQKDEMYKTSLQTCNKLQAKLFSQNEVASSLEITDINSEHDTHHLNEMLINIEQIVKELEQMDRQLKQTETEIEHLLSNLSLLRSRSIEKKEGMNLKNHQFMKLLNTWKKWLNDVELSTDLSPVSVLDLFQQVDQAMMIVTQIEKNMTKINMMENKIVRFEKEVANYIPNMDQNEIVQALKWQRSKAILQVQKKEERDNIEANLDEILEEVERTEKRIELIEVKIQRLWKEAQASDEASFLTNVYDDNKRIQLEHELHQIQYSLQDWVGEKKIEKLETYLKENQPKESIYNQLEELSYHLSTEESLLNDLRDQKGRKSGELEKLESDMNHAEYLLAYEGEETKIKELSSQWATHSFALHLIKMAKKKYEEERQPGVLMKASTYLEKMTNGAFRRVMVPFGEKQMIVERANGSQLETSFLSRGTAELLYLAMRFALAEEFGEKVNLPFIMDDIFVNFDATRLQSTLNVLKEVAENHQLILFTCHEHVQQAMKDMFPQIENIDLNYYHS